MKKIIVFLFLLSLSFSSSAIGVGGRQAFSNVKTSTIKVQKNIETEESLLSINFIKNQESNSDSKDQKSSKETNISKSLVEVLVTSIFDFVKMIVSKILA